MSKIVNDGPAATEVSGPCEDLFKDPAYFRVLSYYQPASNSMITRFDVGTGRQQFNGLLYGWRKEADPGTPMMGEGPLLIPSNGVDGGWAIVADRKTLADILRGLADKLDD